jgi:hypothetical protein
MKKIITITILGSLTLASTSALAASKYQVKAGSWLDAYVSETSCKNSSKTGCTMVNLSGCKGGPANVYMTSRNAGTVEKSKNSGSKVRVFDRTLNAEVCSI